MVHTPATQTWPVVQRVPQVPQLDASFCRLTQRPLHMTLPAWHSGELPSLHFTRKNRAKTSRILFVRFSFMAYSFSKFEAIILQNRSKDNPPMDY